MTTSENTGLRLQTRYAIMPGQADKVLTIERYLPNGYDCIVTGDDVLIFGQDEGGWTLDKYVIPRLASGLYFAKEMVW